MLDKTGLIAYITNVGSIVLGTQIMPRSKNGGVFDGVFDIRTDY
jgi:hypothetical protein